MAASSSCRMVKQISEARIDLLTLPTRGCINLTSELSYSWMFTYLYRDHVRMHIFVNIQLQHMLRTTSFVC